LSEIWKGNKFQTTNNQSTARISFDELDFGNIQNIAAMIAVGTKKYIPFVVLVSGINFKADAALRQLLKSLKEKQ